MRSGVAAPDLCAGYTDPALTAEAFTAEGWYRTGDIGTVDDDGWLTITDRLRDIIIRGGETISPVEVETVLLDHPAIAEVAIVAAPDDRLGERGRAVITAGPGAEAPSLDQIRVHLERAGLARQKWPEELTVVEALPRTPTGKIKKSELRDRP